MDKSDAVVEFIPVPYIGVSLLDLVSASLWLQFLLVFWRIVWEPKMLLELLITGTLLSKITELIELNEARAVFSLQLLGLLSNLWSFCIEEADSYSWGFWSQLID